MANWNNPTLASNYTNFVSEVKDRDLDLAKGMDPAKVTVTNPVADMLRWSSASSKWQRYDGSAWVDMAGTYGIRVTSADVLATARTIALSGGATGTATSFNGSANITIPITGLNMGNATAGVLSVDRGGTGTTTATGVGDLVRSNGPTLIAPIVGTAAAGNETDQAASTRFVQEALDAKPAFPSGTSMLFMQAAAPIGWTKQTTHNDKALRIVSGTTGGTAGGSSSFSSIFASNRLVSGALGATTLTVNEIPSHQHISGYRSEAGGAPALYGVAGVPGGDGLDHIYGPFGTSAYTSFVGGGGAHTHSFTGTAMNFSVQYVDAIIATKD